MGKKKTNTGFSLHETQEAVLCSDLSYYPPYTKEYNEALGKLKTHLSDDSLVGITPFYKTSPTSSGVTLAGYVIATEEKLIVAYHGTNDAKELINDFRVINGELQLQDGTKVDGQIGFIDEFLSSNQNRLQAMMMASNGRQYKNIVYAGHSLGGAMASYAALYDKTAENYTPEIKTKVMTFGTPGCLSANAVEKCDQLDLTNNTLHTQLQYDPVTIYQRGNAQLVGRKLVIPSSLNSSLHAIKDGYDQLFSLEVADFVHNELVKPSIEAIENYSSYFGITSYSDTLTKVVVEPVYNALFSSNNSSKESLLQASEANTRIPIAPLSSPKMPKTPPRGSFVV